MWLKGQSGDGDWGTGGPEFKSRRSDQLNQEVSADLTPTASRKPVIGKLVGGIDGLGNIRGSQHTKPLQRPSSLSPEQMRAPVRLLEARVRGLREFKPGSISTGDDPTAQSRGARIRSTLSPIYGEDTLEFARSKRWRDLIHCTVHR